MLDGIKRNPIIVGAYAATDGICPMLAAHRGGGRTSFIAGRRVPGDRPGRRGRRAQGTGGSAGGRTPGAGPGCPIQRPSI
jgi:hypothetical protein